jgi:hypothetical protein
VAVDSVQESRIVFECEYLDAFARYILIVGYGYVIAINAGYVGFRRLGWIDETREPATVTGGKPRPR